MDKQLTPMQLHRTYGTCHDTITALDWSEDSQFIAVASKDLTARVYSLNPIPGWTPPTLSGHKSALIGVYFTTAATQDAAELVGQQRVVLYTMSKDGALYGWSLQQQQEQQQQQREGEQQQQQQGLRPGLSDGTWVLSARHFFLQRGARLTAADFHKKTGVLLAGGWTGTRCSIQLAAEDPAAQHTGFL
jgi:periodic tryptophan protein 2